MIIGILPCYRIDAKYYCIEVKRGISEVWDVYVRTRYSTTRQLDRQRAGLTQDPANVTQGCVHAAGLRLFSLRNAVCSDCHT